MVKIVYSGKLPFWVFGGRHETSSACVAQDRSLELGFGRVLDSWLHIHLFYL